MRGWVAKRVDAAASSSKSVVVILDQDRWLDAGELAPRGTVVEVESWYQLRRVWEQQGRRQNPSQALLFILVRDVPEPRDLPYDIEQQAAVVSLRLPIADPFKALVRAVPGERGDLVVSSLLAQRPDPLEAVLDEVWRVRLPSTSSTPAIELDAVARLRSDPATPTALWELLRPRLSHPLSKALAKDPPDPGPLQVAWEDWCQRGSESPWHNLLMSAGPSLTPLFALGLLKAVPDHRDDLPGWVSVGTRSRSPFELVSTLLEVAPAVWPADLSGWTEVSRWWGEVRAAMAEGSPDMEEIVDRCWAWWEEADLVFREWLMSGLGTLMTSASSWPMTVARIGPFLARRVRDQLTRRILLIVIDGMGMAQWSLISREAGLKTVTSGGCLAMVPTLTSVSRQAIFAGAVPSTFPDTLHETNSEGRRWRELWQREAPAELGIESRYWRMVGQSKEEAPDLRGVDAAGVVVNAVDEMMHGSEVLGDSQFFASIRTWVRHGFLKTLVENATAKGFEVWITADHGNLEAVHTGRPLYEGLAVESAGTRVRWYGDEGLRSQSGAEGIVWDPPGLPADSVFPIFARGRGGYFNTGKRITHGGISMDEVIVPLVRVEP